MVTRQQQHGTAHPRARSHVILGMLHRGKVVWHWLLLDIIRIIMVLMMTVAGVWIVLMVQCAMANMYIVPWVAMYLQTITAMELSWGVWIVQANEALLMPFTIVHCNLVRALVAGATPPNNGELELMTQTVCGLTRPIQTVPTAKNT